MRSSYYSFFQFSLLLFSFMSCQEASSNIPAQSTPDWAELPALKNKKVLIVHGGWDGHKPDLYAQKVNKWLMEAGAQVTVSDSLGIYKNETLMAEMDLIIQSVTLGKLSPDEFKGLEKAVKNGAGFAGSHGGFCDAFRNHTEYQYMTGGQFVKHPGGQVDHIVNIIDPDDPITRGVPDFETHTEQYYMHIDPNVKVLATTTFNGEHDNWIEGAVVPVIWKKYHGKGRIFCITIGHDPNEFDEPIPQKLLLNGFRWASGSKYEPMENWLRPVYQKN
ncbi:MAG: ThuA domain-containing protein [Bacteroidota bacterium]